MYETSVQRREKIRWNKTRKESLCDSGLPLLVSFDAGI